MSIQESNEKIAKYMGIKCSPVGCIQYDGGRRLINVDELEYDERYDWLMPVVEKINSGPSAYDCVIIDRDVVLLHQHGNEPKHFWFEKHGGRKGAIYAAVCEYINNLK